jgi:peptide chain release factor 1
MDERIAEAERRYEEISSLLADPATISDPAKLREVSREHARLTEIVEAARARRRTLRELADARGLLQESGIDPEFEALARQEVERLEAEAERNEAEVKRLLIPRDPLDDRDAVVEVRAGTGGDEAALFAGDLFRMYTRFAESRGWRVEVVSVSEGGRAG